VKLIDLGIWRVQEYEKGELVDYALTTPREISVGDEKRALKFMIDFFESEDKGIIPSTN
jgi:hypothetical protein